MTTLREAAQRAHELIDDFAQTVIDHEKRACRATWEARDAAYTALRTALASEPQAEPAPVGEISLTSGGVAFGAPRPGVVWANGVPPIGTRLYTHPAPPVEQPDPGHVPDAGEMVWQPGAVALSEREILATADEHLQCDADFGVIPASVLRFVQALAAAQPAAPGWLPIETAPMDGTSVLVYPPTWGGKTCSVASYNTDKYAKKPRPYWDRDDSMGRVSCSRECPPTHWQPLPPPPAATQGAKT